jgi:NADH-quinone oxidoreductase subunit M
MQESSFLLTYITFIPLIGAFIILAIPHKNVEMVKKIALVTAIIDLALCIYMISAFDTSIAGMQFKQTVDWINVSGMHIQYAVGIDGISVLFVFLTALLTIISVIYSWNVINFRQKEYYFWILFLHMGVSGVFMSLDLFLFYLFWEIMLVPMYLLIGVWGGENRLYASIKFFLYTLAGSVFMLVAIAAIYFKTGTFSVEALFTYEFTKEVQFWLFIAFALGFAIKVPMVPFHTWLPDAHVQAPTAGSVILAGVLLKMGSYGFLRFCLPMFPDAVRHFMPLLLTLSVIGIIYGALMALAQTDLKKLVAYSSVSHMGFIMLGIFAFNQTGIAGGVLQMFNHGITTGALFLCVGCLYERTHTKQIADLGGFAKQMPVYAVLFGVFSLSSLGLPGTNGFVGEFTIILGAYMAESTRIYAIFAMLGIIFGAAYTLWMYQRVMFQELKKESYKKIPDLSLREIIAFAPLFVFTFWIGLYPAPFFNIMAKSIEALVK